MHTVWMNDMNVYFIYSFVVLDQSSLRCISRPGQTFDAFDENYCIRSTIALTFDLSTYANRIHQFSMRSHKITSCIDKLIKYVRKVKQVVQFDFDFSSVFFCISIAHLRSTMFNCEWDLMNGAGFALAQNDTNANLWPSNRYARQINMCALWGLDLFGYIFSCFVKMFYICLLADWVSHYTKSNSKWCYLSHSSSHC